MPNFQKIRPENLVCKTCDAVKILRRPFRKPVEDPPRVLNRLKGDIFIIRPILLNGKPYGFVLIN